MHHDGDRYFDDEVLKIALAQEPGSRDTLIYLSPADFLAVAMSGFNDDKELNVKTVLETHGSFNEVPFLNFVHDGEGTARVTGHEGRHRARALQAQGVESMPVLLRHRYDENGHALVWDRIFKDPISYTDGWPERLYGERGDSPETRLNGNNWISFPVDDPRVTKHAELEVASPDDVVKPRGPRP